MAIHRIAIVGCGLIGGSIGCALRASGFKGAIAGNDAPAVLEDALRLGAIDAAEPSLERALRHADVIVLATPVSAILSLLPLMAKHAPPQALITDTGSTKAEIMARAKTIFGDDAHHRFLPGHPIAGKERSGIKSADPDLFRSATWIFTPIAPPAESPAAPSAPGQSPASAPANTAPAFTKRQAGWIELVRRTGAQTVLMTAAEHDLMLAFTSHLPQLLSTALANTVLRELVGDAGPRGTGCIPAGRGLKDMTRLAHSDPRVWRDILATNSVNIQRAIADFQRQVEAVGAALKAKDFDEVEKVFQAAARISHLA